MSKLRVRPLDGRRIRISGIEPIMAACLQELPDLLQLSDSQYRGRLFPPPTVDEKKFNDEWFELMAPELRQLFAASADVVARDLINMQPEPRTKDCCQLVVPVEHTRAWMSAVNQARLILGERHNIHELDLNRHGLDMFEPRDKAILQIHLLGYLLQQFVEMLESPV
jgi:hypothetical protein